MGQHTSRALFPRIGRDQGHEQVPMDVRYNRVITGSKREPPSAAAAAAGAAAAERFRSINEFPTEDDYQYVKGVRCRYRYREQTQPLEPAQPSGQFHRHHFVLKGVLGKGGFATVYKCQYLRNNETYALRRLKKRRGFGCRAQREKTILFAVDYPFIIKLYETFVDDVYLYFLLELAPCGSLDRFVAHTTVNENVVRFWVAQLVLVVEYLHAAEIVHRDIKLDNLLLHPNGYIKLSDFDTAKSLETCDGKTTSFVGTVYYIAPEVMCRQPYGKEADWWTVGIVTHVLLYQKSPLEVLPATYNALQLKAIVGPGFNRKSFGPASDAAKDFMYWTLRTEPMFRLGVQRPSQGAVKDEKFFHGIDFKALYLHEIPFPTGCRPPTERELCQPTPEELVFTIRPSVSLGVEFDDF